MFQGFGKRYLHDLVECRVVSQDNAVGVVAYDRRDLLDVLYEDHACHASVSSRLEDIGEYFGQSLLLGVQDVIDQNEVSVNGDGRLEELGVLTGQLGSLLVDLRPLQPLVLFLLQLRPDQRLEHDKLLEGLGLLEFPLHGEPERLEDLFHVVVPFLDDAVTFDDLEDHVDLLDLLDLLLGREVLLVPFLVLEGRAIDVLGLHAPQTLEVLAHEVSLA